MARLELKLLGSLEIQLGGNPVTQLKSRKAQALLIYLAATRKAHSREWLAGMFWGGMPEDKARMNLSQALSTLRRNFQGHISSDRYTVSLQPGSQIWTDAATLHTVKIEDIPALHHVAQLFRGDFLEGFYIPDCPDFEFWMLAERANCRERILQVLDHLVNHYIQQGAPGCSSAIMFNKQRLGIEPWHEETHRSLMRLYAFTGQRSKALKQYAECQEVLFEELGVEPDLKTTKLYVQIRDNDKYRITQGAGIQQKEYASNLPHHPTDFIGREQELAQLNKLVVGQGCQLVVLTGLGGIGKTRLAVEFGSQLLKSTPASHQAGQVGGDPFPDGVFFVPLEAQKTADAILPAVARAVDLRLDIDIQQAFQQLKSRRFLLIIDNLEHLPGGADILAEMLKAAPDLQVLATSRESLGIYGEQVFPLTGLNYPVGQGGETVEFPAGELFIKAARRHNPAFTCSTSDIKHLVRICQMVEGMPLALEIAASWTKMIPLSSISKYIQEDLQFLRIDHANLPARHRNLYSIIERTIAGLTDQERQTFFGLAVFEGGFTLQAAEQVLGVEYLALAGLLDKSLLRYNQHLQRYFMHPLVHQFGLDRISANPQAWHEINHQHSRFYCHWFADLVKPSNLRSQGQRTIVDAMSADLDNTLNAWMWALNNQDYKRLIGKTDSLGLYFIWRGGYVEGANKFQAFVDTLQEINSVENTDYSLLLASLSNWLAFFLDILGRSPMAFEILQNTRKQLDSPLLAAFDTRAERAHNLSILTRVYLSLERISRVDLLLQAVELYRQVEHPFGLPFALSTLARFNLAERNHTAAENNLHESLEIYRQSGNDIGLTISLVGLGNLAFIQNNYRQARQFYSRSIKIASANDSPERVVAATLFRGIAHLFSGQFNAVMAVMGKCAQDARERGLQGFLAYANYFMGYACLHLGSYHQVVDFANAALPLADHTGEVEMSYHIRMLLTAVNLAEGDLNRSFDGFQEARKFHGQKNFVRAIFGENCGVFGLAITEMGNGNLAAARHLLTQYLQQAIEVQRLDLMYYALCGHVKLNQQLGDPTNAIYLWRMISSHPFIHNSRWFNRLILIPLQMQVPVEDESWHRQLEQRSIWDLASDLIESKAR